MKKKLFFNDMFKCKSVSLKISGVEYDIMKKDDVKKIPCLPAVSNIFGENYEIGFILKRNAQHIYENGGDFDLAICCLQKCNELDKSGFLKNDGEYNKNEPIIICFQNGVLQGTFPSNKCNQYTAKFLISDGLKFNLENSSEIDKIPIPTYDKIHFLCNISQSLDYVLKRKAGDLSKKGLFDTSIVCLRKSNELMSKSPICWNKKDYFYIVSELTRAGRFAEAKKEKEYIETHYFKMYDFKTMHEICLQKSRNDAATLSTDLVESDNPPNCSELCAKYRKRIYSLSGTDKRFPPMTEEVYTCGLLFYPYVDGISKPKYCKPDEVFSYNNRPFADDRTDVEKDKYHYFIKQGILVGREATDFLEYSQIRYFIPQIKLKSLKAYQEMKYDNTDEFQNLVKIAEETGIDIEF